MRGLVLTRYGVLGASSRYRSLQYIPSLIEHGFEFDVAPLLDDDYLQRTYLGKRITYSSVLGSYLRRFGRLLASKQYDFIWLEKEFFPWLPFSVASLALRGKVPYVVDYDDALFHQYDRNPSLLIRALYGKNIDKVMKHSALVIAGNAYLAQHARGAGAKRIEVIPTVIDIKRYPPYERKKNHILKIGWIGSPSTTKYLHLIDSALTAVCRDYGATVALIGAREIDSINFPVEYIPWSYETEVQSLQGLDIGVMPLPDLDWERGKCGLKIIQYMGCSLPVVASPVGVNSEIVEHGVNGYLATNKEEWYRYLSRLLADSELRSRMGRAGRAKVDQSYSLHVMAPKITELVKQVVMRAG
ncbi:D-inositol-3-phosphate glycosyltransferase [Peptococcaceae bacterium CEB3]|nr:D-inositol-3-phosphate glycosyltransferase [Peptococcaceae bacterium CEB3]